MSLMLKYGFSVGVFFLSVVLPAEQPQQPARPPRSIQIALGQRQLFLDDFMLGDIYQIDRVIHQPIKYAGNPIIRADLPTDGTSIELREAPIWDERAKLWKIWYFRTDERGADQPGGGSGFAQSKDGLSWEKPNLGLVENRGSRNNNIVLVKGEPAAFTQHVIIDPNASSLASRYKGMIGPHDRRPMISADGFVFTPLPVPAIPSGDESHLFWDVLQKKYVMTVKHNGPFGRSVYLTLSKDFEIWSDPILIYHADLLDQQLGEKHIRAIEADPRMWRPTINEPKEYNTEIYNMPIFVYEGLYIGLPLYFESSGRVPLPIGNQDGTNSVKLTCSRDLRSWTRVGDRTHFIPISPLGKGQIDTGQVVPSSHPIKMGNELWFYYSGLDVRYRPDTAEKRGKYLGAIHLAKLRLDGFVSMHANHEGGFLDTRPLNLDAERLFVNAAVKGELRAEIVERGGRKTLPGWGFTDCTPIVGDHLKIELRWSGRNLRELQGKDIVVRFHLKDADLFSFWLE